MKLGTYRIGAGDRYRVRGSRRSHKEGYTVADAGKFVKGADAPRTYSPDGVNGSDVVQQAKTWLGVPYRYGGISRKGVDCSGLVYKVFGNLGVSCRARPRTSAVGEPPSPRPDRATWVFFGHTNGGGVEHVGIVTRDDQAIHAPSPVPSSATTRAMIIGTKTPATNAPFRTGSLPSIGQRDRKRKADGR